MHQNTSVDNPFVAKNNIRIFNFINLVSCWCRR